MEGRGRRWKVNEPIPLSATKRPIGALIGPIDMSALAWPIGPLSRRQV